MPGASDIFFSFLIVNDQPLQWPLKSWEKIVISVLHPQPPVPFLNSHSGHLMKNHRTYSDNLNYNLNFTNM